MILSLEQLGLMRTGLDSLKKDATGSKKPHLPQQKPRPPLPCPFEDTWPERIVDACIRGVVPWRLQARILLCAPLCFM